jgi:S1-C subfamily serine protease
LTSRPLLAHADDVKNVVSVAKELRGEIVQIVVTLPNGESRGSGFWVTDTGYVATCWHVVKSNPTAAVQVRSAADPLFDLKNSIIVAGNWNFYSSATVIAHDEENDIALLKPDTNPFAANFPNRAQFKRATLNSDLPKAGQSILIAGYPLGLPYSVVQEGLLPRQRLFPLIPPHFLLLGFYFLLWRIMGTVAVPYLMIAAR